MSKHGGAMLPFVMRQLSFPAFYTEYSSSPSVTPGQIFSALSKSARVRSLSPFALYARPRWQ